MPIYEDQMKYEDMKKAAKTHQCAECGRDLNVAWSAERNCYMLRCQDLTHGTITKHRQPSPAEIEGRKNFNKGERNMVTGKLEKWDPTKMLARIEKARFSQDLTPAQKQMIANTCIEYGLDPLFGELMLYQGRPYVTIDARRRKAQETNELDGINSRPATPQERKARQVPDEDYLYVAEVWRKGASHPFEGWGRVRKIEIDRAIAQAREHGKQEDALPIVKDPGDLAEKRAEAEGLRRGFHLPLPSYEDIIEGEFKVVTEEKPTPQSKTKPIPAKSDTTAPPVTGTATDAQRRKIFADAKKMGYTEDDMHAIIKDRWGVESTKDLSVAQASALIDMIARGEGLDTQEPENLGPEHPIHDNPDDSN